MELLVSGHAPRFLYFLRPETISERPTNTATKEKECVTIVFQIRGRKN